MISNKKCKFYYQHYGYSKKDKWLHDVQCAHCTCKGKHKTCLDCPDFEPKEENDENKVISIINAIKKVEKSLSHVKEELKRLNF